jgi:hypothetical protein
MKKFFFFLPGHNNSWNSHQLHSPTITPQSKTIKTRHVNKKKTKTKKRNDLPFFTFFGVTSLWPLAAAKWRGELRPPKVEYLARQGLQSNNILASTKSPSLAAETNLSPDAEHPNEFPIALPSSLSLSPLSLSQTPTFNTTTIFQICVF